ncbi:MAG: hypothetical protein IKN43_09060, partial [Selenomonadaceae bacterium]|nr:hypothetical protein [Selenomonadaceae bacterium]
MTVLEKAEKQIDDGECDEAIAVLRKAESYDEIMTNEGFKIAELFGGAFKVMGDAKRAAAAYFDAAMKDRFLRAQRWHLSSYIFILHYLQDINTKELYDKLTAYENLFADVEKFSPRNFAHDKIRIGYLLPYAKKSSLKNFIRPLFTKYNRDDFEVYVYTFSTDGDEFTDEIVANV